ncbi:MAG: DUF308 domain-containing protein [Bacilli bacterium]|nr:DUF308 domain-containing protein [Bacilli bacterium]
MKSIFKRFNWMQLVFGILLVAVGVITIILAIVNRGAISKTLSIVFAIFFFIFGGIAIIMSLVSDTKIFMTGALVYGSVLIAVGIILLIQPGLISSMFVTLIAVFLIAFGSVALVKGVVCIVYKMKWYWIAALFLIAAVGITLGILSFCYKDIAFAATFIGAGVGIIILGVLEIISYVLLVKEQKEAPAE